MPVSPDRLEELYPEISQTIQDFAVEHQAHIYGLTEHNPKGKHNQGNPVLMFSWNEELFGITQGLSVFLEHPLTLSVQAMPYKLYPELSLYYVTLPPTADPKTALNTKSNKGLRTTLESAVDQNRSVAALLDLRDAHEVFQKEGDGSGYTRDHWYVWQLPLESQDRKLFEGLGLISANNYTVV